ncbi:Transcription initiation factor TFIID component TAF4 [Metarhizium album ARSEF 1941]|uniref:Transcription initiation factor TFIID subunit 4 n=1 Tax=Metarhizium album (strain ARSEF 1941) TaxID=1081103 RepID=A0A0B2WUR1_METAS|nr:Transcription initiation factor TFIID component TAF4 [Metarhizium album ARSEF 1941]KHN97354.1 Transcription initiation factor TFIID component TAF4 [Metarhizium album ARSEF 1941]
MAQSQSQVPPRSFSPPQHSPSPSGSQPGFALPPNKRVRTDGGPASQPGSPYILSPYAASPGAAGSPPPNAASPTFSQTTPMSSGYNTPYTNGHTASAALNLPDARAGASTPPLHTPQPPPISMPQYTNAAMAPIPQAMASPAPLPNVMGPPQRPAERPTKDYEYDVTDSLAGTGIDLRAEEQYMSELYSSAMDANSEARTGFAQHAAGGKSSFYGAGPANQPAENVSEQDQKKLAVKAAEQAWAESSMWLAVQRTQEINDPFLLVAILHRRAEKIAKDNHIGLNLDSKNNAQTMGKMRLPEQFPTPKVTVKVDPGPDSTLVHTTGSYIPHDSYLVDQLALLSIATKQRIREMVEDADVVAVNRQKTSHGEIPEQWAAAAAPMNAEPLGAADGAPAAEEGEEGVAVPSDTAPLKRSADEAVPGNGAKPPKKLAKISSFMTVTMRELARQEREWEEARLRRRQKRKDGVGDGVTPSRSGSVAPGTPGSVAPEGDKPMTKKEMKKNQALKAAEANSHANQNLTSSMFAGLGGKSSLFGKKKGAKTYDWMNVGRGGSGASTPTRAAPGGGKGINGTAGATPSANLAMTTEGRNRLGTWREDKEKGKNIQLRDWVVVLERDGRESKALQQAYVALDGSNPK